MKTYCVVRKYKDGCHPNNDMIVKEGLTLDEVKAHCQSPETEEKGVWFDCFYEE